MEILEDLLETLLLTVLLALLFSGIIVYYSSTVIP